MTVWVPHGARRTGSSSLTSAARSRALTSAGLGALRRAQTAMEARMTPHYTAPADPEGLLEALGAMRSSLLRERLAERRPEP
jgi:hypothetical protein